MGKSYALMTLSIILRLNPYNLVFSMFNMEEFTKYPLIYFSNEALHSLYYLYVNNNKLNIKELESFYKLYNTTFNNELKLILKAFESFKKMIKNVIEAYDYQINIYFILDNYQSVVNNDKYCLINFLENIDFSEKSSLNDNIKIILCMNTENNDLIITKCNEANQLNDFESIESKLIFVDPREIEEDDFVYFIKRKFLYNEKLNILNVIKFSGYNFKNISSFFESYKISYEKIDVENFFLEIVENEFNCFIDSKDIQLDKKVFALFIMSFFKSKYDEYILYQIQHNKNFKNLVQDNEKENNVKFECYKKYEYFSRDLFKNLIFKYLFPKFSNNTIVLKWTNYLICCFMKKFSMDNYIKKLKLK